MKGQGCRKPPDHWLQKKPWQKEIERALPSDLKCELDALANKDFRHLTKTYLQTKLKGEHVHMEART